MIHIMLQRIKSQIQRFFKDQFISSDGKHGSFYYDKLKRMKKFQQLFKSYKRIYFLGGFEYNEDNYERFKEAYGSGEVSKFINDQKYNSQGDNIELYFIEDINSSNNYLLVLLDPLELLAGESILNIFKSPDINIRDFKAELIYS